MSSNRVAASRAEKESLTLADLTLVRRIGQDTLRLSGAEVAHLLDAVGPDSGDESLTPHAIAVELDGLAELMVALSDTDPGPAPAFVSDAIRKLARRVQALEPSENSKAGAYQVEVVPDQSRKQVRSAPGRRS